MKKIDVLWLVEHTAREMDVACAVKSLAQARYGIDITIRNIHLHDVIKEYLPAVVVLPFFYRVVDKPIRDFVDVWPAATYFNLAWEQIHYKAHVKMKAPGDEFTKEGVIHHAWADFSKNYLVENGVLPENIFVNGNPAYQLYKDPYKGYFKQRVELANQFGLDASKRWVFIPENYKWAFFSDEKLRRSADKGRSLADYQHMRAFCHESLGHLLRWCNEVDGNGRVEIIFRPRPATNSQQMAEYFQENVGVPAEHLHFIKAHSVREWIMASDLVVSSISTSLIEAAVAGKPIYIVEPLAIPEALHCDWYGLVPRIRNFAEFEQACLNVLNDNHRELRAWAQEEMLSNGDPIEGLSDFIGHLIRRKKMSDASLTHVSRVYTNLLVPVTSLAARLKRRSGRLIKHSLMAVRSLFSMVKILFPDVFYDNRPDVEADIYSDISVMRRLFDRLTHSLLIFGRGFRDRDYHNPATLENDMFTEVEVNERVQKWREILAND